MYIATLIEYKVNVGGRKGNDIDGVVTIEITKCAHCQQCVLYTVCYGLINLESGKREGSYVNM